MRRRSLREVGAVRGGGPCRRLWWRVNCAVLEGAFNAERVADLDVGEGDGLATFAEGGIFVGGEGVGGIVGAALRW